MLRICFEYREIIKETGVERPVQFHAPETRKERR